MHETGAGADSSPGGICLALLAVAICALATAGRAGAQSVVATLTRPGWRPVAVAVWQRGNRVAVTDETSRSVVLFDGTTHAELASVSIEMQSVYTMLVDEPSGKLYVKEGAITVTAPKIRRHLTHAPTW